MVKAGHRPIGFLEPDGVAVDDRSGCPCGSYSVDERKHESGHLRWSLGVRVPTAVVWPHGLPIAVITEDAPAAWQNLAHEAAVVAQRHGGYDFASFPRYRKRHRWEPRERETRAYLYHVDGRVVGFLSSMDDPVIGHWDLATDKTANSEQHPVVPSVGVLFVAQRWRRHGIATALVRAVAADRSVLVEELPWFTPLTKDGRALARTLNAAAGKVLLA